MNLSATPGDSEHAAAGLSDVIILEQMLSAGLALIPIPRGRKGPTMEGWNTRAACITDPLRAGELVGQNAGLAHAYSGTCALDVDDFQAAAAWLQTKRIGLVELCMADDAVQVRSGADNRAKLLYRVEAPIRTVRISPAGAVMLELRCATADGLTVQDVVYGTHPSGRPYQLLGDPTAMPPMPPALRELWQEQLHREGTNFPPKTTFTASMASEQAAELREALTFLDADSREQWVEVGAALHVYGDQGRHLWNEWSQRSPKYDPRDQERVWRSFRDDRPGLTIRSIFGKAQRAGWVNPLAGATAEEPSSSGNQGRPRTMQAGSAIIKVDTGTVPAKWVEPHELWRSLPAPVLQPEWLPASIAEHAFEQGELMGADPGMLAMGSLAAAGAVIHDAITIQPKRHDPTWQESARLWVLLLGDPSIKKTPGMKKATDPLWAIHRRLAEAYAKEKADYETDMEEWKRKRDEAARPAKAPRARHLKLVADNETGVDASKDDGEASNSVKPNPPCHLEVIADNDTTSKASKRRRGEPPNSEKPTAPRHSKLIVDDFTVEALANVLADNPGGVICVQQELGAWFGSMDAYRSSAGPASRDRSHFLKAYDGGPHQVDRVTRGSRYVENFGVSLLGAIQPDSLRRIVAALPEDGLMQRFLAIVCAAAGRGIDRPANMAVIDRYRDVIAHLHGTQPGGGPVRLSEEAHEIRDRFEDWVVSLMDAFAGSEPRLHAHLGKWSGMFARLLLVFHCIEGAENESWGQDRHPSARLVSGVTARRVHDLFTNYLFRHAVRFYLEDAGGERLLYNARRIVGMVLVKQLSTLSRRDLTRHMKGAHWDSLGDRGKDEVLQFLCDTGWLEPAPGERYTGRPTRWLVNPDVHGRFSDRREAERARRATVRSSLQGNTP